jgi:GlpG protein
MRIIGHLQSEPDARTFSYFLYAQGIRSQFEREENGHWAIWIHDEEQLDSARKLLKHYQARPNDPEINRLAQLGPEMLRRDQEEEKAAARRFRTSKEIFPESSLGMGRVTTGLIAISVVMFLMTHMAQSEAVLKLVFISNFDVKEGFSRLRHGLPEVREGQVWRLLTPIFIHPGGFIHILFNMLWLRDLGTMVERRHSSRYLLLQVVAIGLVSNFSQYLMSGPRFGGMSGVVFGLLGYIWIRGRLDPRSGFFLPQWIVIMMLAWLLFGFTGILPIANTAHTVGLLSGVAWAYLAVQYRDYRR